MSQSASFDGGSLSLTQFGQIMSACDRFEAEWRAGRRPRSEQYLAEASEPCRAALHARAAGPGAGAVPWTR